MPTPASEETQEIPTPGLVVGAVGDACASCGSPLATDQRYCLHCGARRGKARFTATTTTTTTAPAAALASETLPPARPGGGTQMSLVLIVGVATLLLAVGVGVLIGKSGNSSSTASRPVAPQVITVGGAAALPTNAAPASTASPADTASHKAAKARTKVVRVAAKAEKQAAQAATKVLGKAAPRKPTVKVGGSCDSSQSGCQNGHFTGSFFGP